MLSLFGELFERLCAERGVSKRDMAKAAGISSSKMTESLRDVEAAKAAGERAYMPDLDKLDVWADALGLKGAERRNFIDLAHLAHAPSHVQRLVARLAKRVADLEGRVDNMLKDAGDA